MNPFGGMQYGGPRPSYQQAGPAGGYQYQPPQWTQQAQPQPSPTPTGSNQFPELQEMTPTQLDDLLKEDGKALDDFIQKQSVVQNMKARVSELENSVKGLKAEESAAEEEQATLESKIDDLKRRLADAQAFHDAKQAKVDDVKKRFSKETLCAQLRAQRVAADKAAEQIVDPIFEESKEDALFSVLPKYQALRQEFYSIKQLEEKLMRQA
mmetsp:Transcript_28787/g.66486  ORF Transcript_28787/g.66486 Transcript_28787/m.66486 type:complete len:210 (-) Transcript_28787:247-876(-)|eukprot:CAMPEP_0114548788 /NCGR_PEP_ID=MMETSP0114-20121206/5175_1 /TAXON_ID=31324 /ORGANISM="Goniomonas sp, Strain m" /LENGTH=209 /DNA_ID=CAMNT_0001733415 /DNA_START=14 /DNA_END=643 /DNA_ORIENTATION=+